MNDIEWMRLYKQALAAATRINELMDEMAVKGQEIERGSLARAA